MTDSRLADPRVALFTYQIVAVAASIAIVVSWLTTHVLLFAVADYLVIGHFLVTVWAVVVMAIGLPRPRRRGMWIAVFIAWLAIEVVGVYGRLLRDYRF
jgi:hypothetical protein